MSCLTISWIALAVAIAAGPADEGKAAKTAEPAKRSAADAKSQDQLPAKFQRLLPLHTKLAPPKRGQWLAEHKEPGQSYLQYVRGRPTAWTSGAG